MTKKCEFKIRNSWGETNIDLDWVTEDILKKNMVQVFYLKNAKQIFRLLDF
jgi:hypothetical protein